MLRRTLGEVEERWALGESEVEIEQVELKQVAI